MKRIINLANEIYLLDKNKKRTIKKAIKYLKDIDYEEFEKFKELKDLTKILSKYKEY